jgi:hypothetical protein
MQTIDIDQQIEQLKAQMQRLMGQLQLLEQLKAAGAQIMVPEPQNSDKEKSQ